MSCHRGASAGLPTGDGAGPGSFFDLQNVQVLKGPQGTLFGRNTTGGAVLLVPQKPTGRFEGYVEGSIGNYDMKRVQAVVNMPLGDTARLRLGVDRQTRDGYLRNVGSLGPSDFSDVDYIAVRGSLVADLLPNLENYTVVSYNRSSNHGPIQKLIAGGAAGLGSFALARLARQETGFYDVMQTLANPSSKSEQWQIVNTTTWSTSDTLTIKNIVSYAQFRQRLSAPLFGTDFLIDFAQISPLLAGLGSYHVPFATTTAPPGINTANQSTFTEELQFQGRSSDDRLIWQGGGYLEVSQPLSDVGSQSQVLSACQNVETFQCSDPIGFLTNLSLPAGTPPQHVGSVNYTVGRTAFHNVGVYGQATYKFTEQLKLTGGIRYTWDHSTNVSTQRAYTLLYPPQNGLFPTDSVNLPQNPRCTNPATVTNNCTANYCQSSQKPTWLVGLDYTPTTNVLLYAKYVRGYRAGTIAPTVSAPFNIVSPEKVDTYEVGLKTSFAGALRGTFNVSGFYNDFSNQQLQLGFTGRPGRGQSSAAAPVNAGKSEIWGVEIDGSIKPFEGLSIDAGYTYLRTKIKSVPDFSTFNDPNYILSPAFKVGDPEVLAPRNKYTISATYTLPLDESVGRISVGATFTHRDSMLTNYADRANPDLVIAALSYLPPLDLLNLNASWNSIAGLPVDVTIFATNVTKQRYYNFISGLGGSTFTNFEMAAVGEPRMYGARLRYSFGR